MALDNGRATRPVSSLFWDSSLWVLSPCPKRAGCSFFLPQEAQFSASSSGCDIGSCSMLFRAVGPRSTLEDGGNDESGSPNDASAFFDRCRFDELRFVALLWDQKQSPSRSAAKVLLAASERRFGLRAKTLLAPDGQPAGYIEYLPGEFAWRGIQAAGYMFIHCVWIYSRRHQRKGWASFMIEACLKDAKNARMNGVAVMVRDGPWLADRRLFLTNGFKPVDTAPPDYQLLVRKFNPTAANPTFQKGWDQKLARYNRGLTIIRSSQCPHIAKFASDISESAAKDYGISPTVVDLESWQDAQNAPTPYAVFSLIYNGRLLADHQISRTRFRNIMNKLPGD
jgi:YoaP-like